GGAGGRRVFELAAPGPLTARADTLAPPRGRCLGERLLPCRRLDEVAADIAGRVDFIKMDAEGAEVEVVKGGEQLIRRDRPRMLIEVHSAANHFRLTRTLAAWGYIVQTVRHPDYPPGSPLRDEHTWLVANPYP